MALSQTAAIAVPGYRDSIFSTALPIAILIGAALSGELTFSLLLMFGMVFGTVSAFVQPARESLLGYTSQDLMHQAVAKVVMVQFIAQGIGFITRRSARYCGPNGSAYRADADVYPQLEC